MEDRGPQAGEKSSDVVGTGAVSADTDLYCSHCGYNLRGAPERRCPECGREFDPEALIATRIPWEHRSTIGRVRAFFKTVAVATFRPHWLSMEAGKPVSLADARRFRWAVLGVVGLLLAVASAMVGWGLRDQWRQDGDLALKLIGSPLVIWGFLAVWSGIPLWFSSPKRLDDESRARATAVTHYTTGPLLWLAVGTFCFAADFAFVPDDVFTVLDEIWALFWIVAVGVTAFLWCLTAVSVPIRSTHRG